MTTNAKDSLIVALLCCVCVLGTYVYLQEPKPGCGCDPSPILKKLDEIDGKLSSRRGGSPAGSPVGNPALGSQ